METVLCVCCPVVSKAALPLKSEGAGGVEDTGLPTIDPLTSRDVGADFRARPNQCGKPCRRLKPPGGRRSSSVALTVSVSEEPVV